VANMTHMAFMTSVIGMVAVCCGTMGTMAAV
jgi:hypothetical protein